ncbi:hypothetical protein [Streptomyces sp. NPDC050164]
MSYGWPTQPGHAQDARYGRGIPEVGRPGLTDTELRGHFVRRRQR